MSQHQFFQPTELHVSKQLLPHLKSDYEKLKENKKDLKVILKNIISQLSQAKTDDDARQAVMEYMMKIPVQLSEGEFQSFGDSLGVSEHVPYVSLPSGQGLSGEDLKELNGFYQQFIESYKQVPNAWQFSYPKNPNGEIMSPQIGEWQSSMMDESFSSDKVRAFKDFKRGYDIDGQSTKVVVDRLKANASDLCVVTLANATPGSLGLLPDQSNTAYLIRTKIPNSLWHVNRANNDKPTRIDLSHEQLREFDEQLQPTEIVQSIGSRSIEELSTVVPIIHQKLDEDINRNIPNLCDQLDVPQDEKDLLVTWLKKWGGQGINRFVDASMGENHFGSQIAFSNTTPSVQNWTIKDNHVVFNYQADMKSIIGENVYARTESPFLQQIPFETLEDMQNNPGKYQPVLKIDCEVMLSIEKNEKGQSVVKPKLVKYDVDCKAAMTDSGKLLIQSPAKNLELIDALKKTPPEKPQALSPK